MGVTMLLSPRNIKFHRRVAMNLINAPLLQAAVPATAEVDSSGGGAAQADSKVFADPFSRPLGARAGGGAAGGQPDGSQLGGRPGDDSSGERGGSFSNNPYANPLDGRADAGSSHSLDDSWPIR